jgi:hypothetical protein
MWALTLFSHADGGVSCDRGGLPNPVHHPYLLLCGHPKENGENDHDTGEAGQSHKDFFKSHGSSSPRFRAIPRLVPFRESTHTHHTHPTTPPLHTHPTPSEP